MLAEYYFRSKLPVGWVLLFAGNLLLVMALELLLLYTAPLPLTAEGLAGADSRLDGAVLTQTQQRGYLHAALAETPDGTVYLVPAKAHGVFFGRGQVMKKQIVPVDAGRDATVTLGTQVEPWEDEASDYPIQMRSKYSRYYSAGSTTAMAKYLLPALALSLAEAALWYKIRG